MAKILFTNFYYANSAPCVLLTCVKLTMYVILDHSTCVVDPDFKQKITKPSEIVLNPVADLRVVGWIAPSS